MSRREMIGVTTALLPIIASIVAPTPVMAQLTGFPFTSSSTSSTTSVPATTTVPTTTTIPSSSPSPFNGTYNGSGTPGTPNLCSISAAPVILVLNHTIGSLTASMTVTHVGSTPASSTVFNSPVVAVASTGANSIRVTGAGSTGPSGYQSTNQFDFTLGTGTAATVAGAQQITYPECGTTPYNITANKP